MPETPSDDDATSQGSWKTSLLVSGFFLLIPPLLALFAALWPSLVPLPVATGDNAGEIAPFLIGVSLLLLVINGGFLFLIYRWLSSHS